MNSAPPPPVSFSRWPWWRRLFGDRSERAAAKFLRRAGLRIVARNVADPQGELDIIAFDPTTQELVIVEVRSTASPYLHRPLDSVNFAKQKRLTEAALRFLARKRLLGNTNVRFDVLAISWPPTAREPVIHHVRHAFEAIGRHQMWQ
jgi:putative endonuclease